MKSTHDTIFEIHAMGLPFSLKSPTILDPAAMLSDRLSFSDMHAYNYIHFTQYFNSGTIPRCRHRTTDVTIEGWVDTLVLLVTEGSRRSYIVVQTPNITVTNTTQTL